MNKINLKLTFLSSKTFTISLKAVVLMCLLVTISSCSPATKSEDTKVNPTIDPSEVKLTVDLSNKYRPVTHSASGSLYGLAEESKPADELIKPTKPFMFTQMAPNGGQLPNGEKKPTGDALKVAAMAERSGAKITIRMPDVYSNFPYQWISMEDWLNKVDSIVKDTVQSGASNIYAYEIWNEPNWTWKAAEAGSFNEAWKKTYEKIRSIDKTTKILGPSISLYDRNWLYNFLQFCKENNCLPDIISWHELGDPEGNHVDGPNPMFIGDHVKSYRKIEESLGIDSLPISINEYSVTKEEGIPGNMIRYIANLERNGVESACAAFWFKPGRLSNLVTGTGKPNGGWWLYKWYGDMTGDMVMTTPSKPRLLDIDGIASIDNSTKKVQVVFGGANGDNTLLIKGFASTKFLSKKVHIKVETSPWAGVETEISSPKVIIDEDFKIDNDQIFIPIEKMIKTSGYNMVITNTK